MPADGLTKSADPRGLGGWPGALVLVATAIGTSIVFLLYAAPSLDFLPGMSALFGYLFIGSLVISTGGGLAMMIRQNNPWWLITLPWNIVLVAMTLIFARAFGLATMH